MHVIKKFDFSNSTANTVTILCKKEECFDQVYFEIVMNNNQGCGSGSCCSSWVRSRSSCFSESLVGWGMGSKN